MPNPDLRDWTAQLAKANDICAISGANCEEEIWAMCTRVDPREDVEILRGNWSTALDPMSYPDNLRALNSRMVVDACRPWARRDTFPQWPARRKRWTRALWQSGNMSSPYR